MISMVLAVPGIFVSSGILKIMGSENSVIETGVFWAIVIAESLLTIFGIIIFKRGK
jgi:hypothetical protein